MRSVLAIRSFRRLWIVSYICSIGDWLGMLALAGLVTKLTESYALQNFAFSGVVLTQLLPGLLFAPIGGLLADRFDRRKVMVICDLLRCALFLSIAFVGTAVWLFIANFLIGCCALVWIPSKEAAIPNLLRRKDQVETANQLSLVMTWGISVISGAGLYAVITGVVSQLDVRFDQSGLGMASVIVVINGLLFLVSAILVATRVPEVSHRGVDERPRVRKPREERMGPWAMLRDVAQFIRTTPLIRGLLIGMVGAFAAAGALIGSSKTYADQPARWRLRLRFAVRVAVHWAGCRDGDGTEDVEAVAAQPAVRCRDRGRRPLACAGRVLAAHMGFTGHGRAGRVGALVWRS